MRVNSKTAKQQKKHPGRQPSLSISKVSINQEKRGRCGGGGRFRGVPGNPKNVDFPLQFLAFLTSGGSPPDPGWWAAEDLESMYPRVAPSHDCRKQTLLAIWPSGHCATRLFGSTQVRSTFQIINILASQILLLSLLFVRAIRCSTDIFLPDVTPPHLERWEFAIIRIRDAPSHVIFPGPPENSGTKGGGHEGQV